MREPGNALAAASRCYDLNGLTLSVTAPDAALCNCLESFVAPLAGAADTLAEWQVRISVADTLPHAQPGLVLWQGDLPEGLPAVLRHDGASRNLLVLDHLALCADSRRKRIDVEVRRGHEAVLRGTASVSILAEIIRGSSLFLVHAACLLQPGSDECLLIFAPSGRGKTTSALALARSGWRLIGDDASILQMIGNEPHAWALPRALTIHRQTEALLPWMADVTKPWGSSDQQAVALSSIEPLISHAAPLPRRCRTTVFLDAPNGSAHAIARLDRSEALLRMFADNLLIAPDGLGDHDVRLLDCLARLAKHTTVLGLSVGPVLETLAPCLAAACARHHHAEGTAVTR